MRPLISFLNRHLPEPPDYELAEYVTVKPSTRAKKLALRLDTKNRIFNLVVPKGFNLQRAYRFAAEHDEWMRAQLAELPQPIKLMHGAVIPIFGQNREIIVERNSDGRRTDISLEEHALRVRTNKDDPSSRIIRFLKSESKARLDALSREKAALIKKDVRSVAVRDTKTRWGSCTADGNLSYSWRLIFAPHASFDYVVAHEVAHLQHLDHSDRFWALCRDLSDDYEAGHGWMKKNSYELMRYE